MHESNKKYINTQIYTYKVAERPNICYIFKSGGSGISKIASLCLRSQSPMSVFCSAQNSSSYKIASRSTSPNSIVLAVLCLKACPKVKAGVRGEEEDMMDIFSVGETSIVVSGPSLKVEANLIFWWHTSYLSQTVLVEKKSI